MNWLMIAKNSPRKKEKNAIKNAIDYMIVSVSPQLIDRINILEASRLGMQLALDEMLKNNKIDLIMTDYMKLKTDLPILSLKHGDATSFSIACASILPIYERYWSKISTIWIC